jgi:Fe2+ or Zn2+ uptake regulation protein
MEIRQTDSFAKQLREKGFKATHGRVRLLEMLRESKKPISVEALAKKLVKHMDQATVYRALEAFAKTGIVKRIDLGHAHAHYELAGEHHHHVVCESCGKVADVELKEPELERAALRAAPAFANVRAHSLEFFGTCRTCA